MSPLPVPAPASVTPIRQRASTLQPLAAGTGDDHPDTSGGNTVVAIGGAAQLGIIDVAGDVDRFRVELAAGERYRFELSSTSSGLRDSELTLRSGTGSKIASDIGSGGKNGAARIDFTAPASGTYYLDAVGAGGATGQYRVSATADFDHFPDDSSTSGRVVPSGAALISRLDYEWDTDRIAVDLIGGMSYRFSLAGTPSGGATSLALSLYSPEGAHLHGAEEDSKDGRPGASFAYSAPASGTYYLTAMSMTSSTGGYQLQVDPVADDYPASTATSGALLLNPHALATGSIETLGDSDYWRVTLSAGTAYAFDLRGAGTDAEADAMLRLRAADGSLIAENDDAGSKDGPAGLAYRPTASGTYYLEASFQGWTGTYELRAAADDFGSDNATAGQLQPDASPRLGTIQYGSDIDRFKVVLDHGTGYTFEVVASGAGMQPTLALRAVDGSGFGGSTMGGGRAEVHLQPLGDGGTYYLDVGSADTAMGEYTVRATPDADDFAASTSTLGRAPLDGSPVSGRLERSGDIDYFKVMLQAGGTYVFSVRGGGGKGDVEDTVLRVRAADGRVLASNDDGFGSKSGGSLITFQAPTDGAYYLDVSCDSSGAGNYTLKATADDYPDGPTTSGIVPVGGAAIAGAIEREGDVDWLRVDLRAGTLYDFELEGTSRDSAGTEPLYLGLQLRAPDGSSSSGNGDTVERLSYLALTDGPHYLIAQSWSTTGSYTLKAVAVPDDLPGSPATAATVRVNGGSSQGTINAGADTDWFKVELSAGTSYRFALSGTGGADALVDTSLRLLGPDGTELAANDDSGTKNGSSAIAFKAASSGTYYLEAAGDGSRTGGYELTARAVLTATSATPANGATDVARSANLVLGFDRPVQSNHGTVNIQLAPEGGMVQRISLDDANQVSINGTVVTIDPALDLAADTRYFVSLGNGALKDASGNLSEGMAYGEALSFVTRAGNQPPTAADHSFATTAAIATTGRLPAAVDADADSITYQLQDFSRQGGRVAIEADGRFTYEAPFWFSGTDQFGFSVTDSQGGSKAYTVTVDVAPLPVVQGTAQADVLAAAAGSSRYEGLNGDDRITTGPGPDIVDGGGGTDTVLLAVPRSAVSLQRRPDGGWTISTPSSGTDQLSHVERLQFTDISTILGMHGPVEQVARVIGAVFGTAQLHDAALVGRYLALAESGVGGESLVARALDDPLFTALAGSRTNADVVGHVYGNVVGQDPGALELDYFSGLIADGAYTQASLLWMACGLDLVAQRIDLAGLAAEGLDYLPAGA